MAKIFRIRHRFTPFQIIILGFSGLILLGTLLLMLPIASNSGNVTPFKDALFTATSAVCVTGLVVHDTASYWSVFGQSLILIMIQIGGIGVVTSYIFFAILSGRKISLWQRSVMQESISAQKVGGIVKLTLFILVTTAAFELVGALAMMPAFIKQFGAKGIWMSVFHAVSAFCNAGFDIMGTEKTPYVSLTKFAGSPLINISVVLLITIGGIGFLTWDDVREYRYHIQRYRMQSKVILVTSAVLVLIPTLFFYVNEFSFLAPKERILSSLFQAVTPRTAGFNTADLTKLSGAGRTVMVILMLIGGSPGSTAGGMKTTTIAVLFANVVAVFGRKEEPRFFGRRLETKAVINASTILLMYLVLFICSGLIISLADKLPVSVCLFEAASAIGTVGLTLGITAKLGLVSRLILIALMFFGRVGGLTLIYAAVSGNKIVNSKLPKESITVG